MSAYILQTNIPIFAYPIKDCEAMIQNKHIQAHLKYSKLFIYN